MTWSRVRLTLAGAGCAALVLFPAFSGAQSPAENADRPGNLTQQAQNEVSIGDNHGTDAADSYHAEN